MPGDYHLKSKAGRFDALTRTWRSDSTTSLCIDKGDPNSDCSREPSPNGERVNLGAFGATFEASKSGSDVVTIGEFNLDTSPGWTMQGEWQFGPPQGKELPEKTSQRAYYSAKSRRLDLAGIHRAYPGLGLRRSAAKEKK